MPFEFGDVVLVPFPFTNQIASKKRPAVIVSNRTYNAAKPDVVLMAVTSQLRASAALGEVGTGLESRRSAQTVGDQGGIRHA
jgi:mRNA interferase MazF